MRRIGFEHDAQITSGSLGEARGLFESPRDSMGPRPTLVARSRCRCGCVAAGSVRSHDQHYRAKDGSGDVWLSDKVSPWGLVKTQDKDRTMVLTKNDNHRRQGPHYRHAQKV